MSDPEKLETALERLAKDPTAKSKMGRMRELWPSINQLNRSGIPHERIWQTLRENGLDISFTSYRQMLFRIRHEPASGQSPPNDTPKKESPTATPPNPPEEPGAPASPTEPSELSQERRPGELPKFDYSKHRDGDVKW